MVRRSRLAAPALAAYFLGLSAVAVSQDPPIDADFPPRYADKLAHKPSPVPDRVTLTWKGDPATSQAVTWRTDTSVTRAVAQVAESDDGPKFAGRLIIGVAPPVGEAVRQVAAVTTPLATDLNDCHCHTAEFAGLRPRTKYLYRVGDGVNWSEWFQFETAAAGPAPLSFLYFGDAQNDVKEHWSRVVRGAYSDMPRAKFVIHAGDLISTANSDAEWGEWHAAAGWINGMVPVVAAPGNHEYGRPLAGGRNAAGFAGEVEAAIAARMNPSPKGLSGHWRPQFAFPENGPPGLEETCYFFDVQGVRVVVLNSNERQAEQAAWLDGVLSANPCRWTVVTLHHPIYSTANGRDNKDLRALWRPVFDRHGVDLVLQGHDHTYGRSELMRDDRNLPTGARAKGGRGTVYVVSVSGPKMYDLDREPWMRVGAERKQLYQLIRIDGDRLSYESRTAKGDLYDAFTLEKDADGSTLTDGPTADRGPPPRDPRYANAAAFVVIAVSVLLAVRWAVRTA